MTGCMGGWMDNITHRVLVGFRTVLTVTWMSSFLDSGWQRRQRRHDQWWRQRQFHRLLEQNKQRKEGRGEDEDGAGRELIRRSISGDGWRATWPRGAPPYGTSTVGSKVKSWPRVTFGCLGNRNRRSFSRPVPRPAPRHGGGQTARRQLLAFSQVRGGTANVNGILAHFPRSSHAMSPRGGVRSATALAALLAAPWRRAARSRPKGAPHDWTERSGRLRSTSAEPMTVRGNVERVVKRSDLDCGQRDPEINKISKAGAGKRGARSILRASRT